MPQLPLCIKTLVGVGLFTLSMQLAAQEQGEADTRPPSEQGMPPGQTLRLNVSPSGYPPYLIVKGDNYSGIIWDVVNRVAERAGFDVSAVQVPRKRVDNLLREGYLDATPRAREWTAHPDQFLFTDPVVNVEEVFFSTNHSDFRYEGPDSLIDKTLVTHLGYRYPTVQEQFNTGQTNRFDVSRDRDMFRYLLYSDEFDAAIADRLVGQWIILSEGLQGRFRMSEDNVSEYGFRLMLRKDWEDFAALFNRELQALKANGELDEILSRYR
jgi:polar amino acid transport system substrate-binding protein